MNRHVMYTYEYANSAWKNNELKQSHTIEGVLKSSCPVQRCMCVTLYMHCDSIYIHKIIDEKLLIRRHIAINAGV
jgi:hypothetical protein